MIAQHNTVLKKFLKKTSNVVAIVYLLLITLISMLGYWIVSDKTPNANRLCEEIGAQSPNFQQLFFLWPREHVDDRSNLEVLLKGQDDAFQYIPIESYYTQQDTLFLKHYVDEGITDTIALSQADFAWTDNQAIQSQIVNKRFLLGTDRYGRDVWSRLVIGGRVSLAVGWVSMLLSIGIGLVLGALAGWYGGWLDKIIMYVINVLWAIPTILLVFAITITIGRGFWEIFIAIGLSSWVGAARMIRGLVMQYKELDFVTAAVTLGYSDLRIISKHILPHIVGPLMVIAASNFASAILVESGLSFLGIGVQPPTPSWGLMIKEHFSYLLTDKPFLALIPGIAILSVVLAVNVIGNGLRDAFDVKAN